MLPLTTKLLILAMFAQVVLTVFVLVKMRAARVKAKREGKVTLDQIAVSPENWPPEVRKIQNAYANQFELPVLFFAGVLLALQFSLNDWVVVILSWLFVASRWVHALVHTGSNYIPTRFRAFFFGLVVLAILWVYIVFRVVFSF